MEETTVEIRLLKYVLGVNEMKSFTKAAQLLCISQPSLSQQIAKLEGELGIRLFHRGHGYVTPTPDGIRFIHQAKRIVQLDGDLQREMRERSEGIGQELCIGTTAITGGHVLPPLLRVFNKQFPHVSVRLIEASTENLEDLTARGEVDLSILPLPLQNPHLCSTPMLTEPLLLALPRSEEQWMSDGIRLLIACDEDTLSKQFHLTQLSMMPFVLLKPGYGFRSTVLQICAENGFQPNVVYETSSIETAQSLVAYGLGVTLVPQMVARYDKRHAPKYVSTTSSLTRTLVFAYSNERYLSLAAKNFLEVYHVAKITIA
jgi:DNA-binding transcriptional LysR family regulator